jgi:hypothetical protein
MDFLGGVGEGRVHGEHAHKKTSYNTKMLLKVVFDKKALVNFNFKNLQKKSANKKSQNICQMFVFFQKENHTLGYGFKNL